MSDKINQSKSNVIGDQIAGDKISNNFYTTILNDSENIDEFTDDFNNFLDKTELHSISIYKELKFNDLYIPIDLNNNNLDKINIEDLYLDFIVNPKNIIIYGNEISGKTSALKYLINNLKNDYTIIYTDDVHNIQLPIKNFILNKKKQIYKKYSNKKVQYFLLIICINYQMIKLGKFLFHQKMLMICILSLQLIMYSLMILNQKI